MRLAALLAAAPLLAADTSPRATGFQPRRLGLVTTIVPKMGSLHDCDFSPDGRRLAAAGEDGSVRLFSTATWKEERVAARHENGAWTVAFSPDGRTLATSGGDRQLRLTDTSTFRELGSFAAETAGSHRPVFSGDGSLVVAPSEGNNAVVWNVREGRESATLTGFANAPLGGAFSADRKQLVLASYSTLKIWNTKDWSEAGSFNLAQGGLGALSMALSGDARELAVGYTDFSVRIWEIGTWRETRKLAGHSGQVFSLDYTPGGKYLVTAGGREVKVWDTKTWTEAASLVHHIRPVSAVALAPGGRWIASAGGDGELKVWGAVPGGATKLRPRGYFGVGVRTGENGEGCVVTEVKADTAAQRAGMQVGDVLLSVDGLPVADHQEAIAAIGRHGEGDEVEFRIRRGGAGLTVRVTLGRRPEGQ